MSRCFPYPPPGYTLSRARNEALIESIKLQKEKQKKKEKKEKRKEKKEKRKEKKEKRKEKKEKRKEKKDKTNQNSDKTDIAKHHIIQESSSDAKFDFLHKKREAEIEQLERSSLTEEHACPATLSVPSTSSDSTQNSNKRTRHSLPVDDTCVGHGKVILIRLPSKKQNEFDALTKEEQQPCSTSRRSDSTAKSQDVNRVKDLPDNRLKGTRDIGHGLNIGNNTRQICSTSGQIEARKTGIKSMPKSVLLTPMQKMDLQYKNLLENCFPPQIQDACLYPDDLDWLVKGRNLDNQGTRAEKKRRFGSDSFSCSRSSGLWPRAEYLCEVDVYAMPFTVPY